MKRKKLLFICLTAVVLCLGGITLAKALKVKLNPIGTDPGGGFVIFNDTSGGPYNVQIQMSLKGAKPNTNYDVIVHIGAPDTHVATVTTNAKGNANLHYSSSVASGDQQVGLGLKREGEWQFGTGLLTHSFK
jgi:hypothetical protein